MSVALVLATFGLGAEPASAQPAGSSAPSAKAPGTETRANELFREAMADVKQQKWAQAEAKFLAALSLNPSFDIASNLGQTQYRLGKYRDAAESLAFAVRSWPVIGKQDHREVAVRRLNELRTLVASVTIRVSQDRATLFVDGKDVGRSPLAMEVFVDPGPRLIEAKLAGYEDAKQTIDAAKGSAQEVSLVLVKAEMKSAPARVGPKPGANGAGSEAGAEAGATAGPKTNEGGALGGQQGPLAKADTGGPHKGLLIAGAATSAVMLGAGAVFAVVSNGHAEDAEKQRAALVSEGIFDPCKTTSSAEQCDAHKSTVTAQVTFGNLSVWSFVIGGAAGVSTAIYALAAPRSKPPAGVQATPMVVSRGGGLVLVGRW